MYAWYANCQIRFIRPQFVCQRAITNDRDGRRIANNCPSRKTNIVRRYIEVVCGRNCKCCKIFKRVQNTRRKMDQNNKKEKEGAFMHLFMLLKKVRSEKQKQKRYLRKLKFCRPTHFRSAYFTGAREAVLFRSKRCFCFRARRFSFSAIGSRSGFLHP